MQPYERIGLVALLFAVVLLVVGVLWDDGSADHIVLAGHEPAVERLDEEAARRQAAEAARAKKLRAASALAAQGAPRRGDQQGQARANPRSDSRTGAVRGMPMGGQDELAGEVSRVTTMSSGRDHRSARLDRDETPTGPTEFQRPAAVAQTADELLELARPARRAGRQAGTGEVSMNSRSDRRRTTADEGRRTAAPERAVSTPAPSKRVAEAPKEQTVEKASSKTAARTYTVKSGDALQKIAARELGDRSRSTEIASLNGLSNPDNITIGMVLTLPARSVAQVAQAPSGAASSSVASTEVSGTGSASGVGNRYTIKKGESLSRALTRELGTYRRSIALVKALNPGLNPDRIIAGQVINLPRVADIPGESQPKARPTKDRRPSAPALDTSTGSSRVAAASRRSDSSTRSDSEFVVR